MPIEDGRKDGDLLHIYARRSCHIWVSSQDKCVIFSFDECSFPFLAICTACGSMLSFSATVAVPALVVASRTFWEPLRHSRPKRSEALDKKIWDSLSLFIFVLTWWFCFANRLGICIAE